MFIVGISGDVAVVPRGAERPLHSLFMLPST